METESISVEPDLPVVYPDADDDDDDDNEEGGATNMVGLADTESIDAVPPKDKAIKIINIQSNNDDDDHMNKYQYPEKIVVKMEPPDEPVNTNDDVNDNDDDHDKTINDISNDDNNNNNNDDDDENIINNNKEDIDGVDDDDDDDDINIPGIETYESMSQEEIFNEFQSEEIMDVSKIKIENELIIEDDPISYDDKINYPQFKNQKDFRKNIRYNNITNVRTTNNNNNDRRYGTDMKAYSNKTTSNAITNINRRHHQIVENFAEPRGVNRRSNPISNGGMDMRFNNPYFENDEEDVDEDHDDDYYDDDFDEDFNDGTNFEGVDKSSHNEISKYNNFYAQQTVSNMFKRKYNNHSNSYVHGRFKCKYCVLMFNDTLSMEQHIDNHLEAISDRNSMIERINRIDNISFICRLCKRTYDSISEILKHKRTTCIANRIPFRTPPKRPIVSMGNQQQQQHQPPPHQYYQQQQQQRNQQWQQQQRVRQQQLSQQYKQQLISRQPQQLQQQQQQQHNRQQHLQQMQRFQQIRKNPSSTLLKPISRQPQLQHQQQQPPSTFIKPPPSTMIRQQKSKELPLQEVTKIEKDIDMVENGVNEDDDATTAEHDGNDDMTAMADDGGDPSIIKPSRIVAYKCTNCNENYTENLYKCIQCAISFYRIPVFKTHLNIHSGESPYKCEICMKTFNRSTTLKSHLNTHSDDKTHVCFQSPQNINKTHNLTGGISLENSNNSNENENDMDGGGGGGGVITLDNGNKTSLLNKCEENIQTDCITISNFDDKPDRKPIKCRMCTGIFDDIHSYNQHYMRIHRDIKYQRPIPINDFTGNATTSQQQNYKLKSNNLLMAIASTSTTSTVTSNNNNTSMATSTFTSHPSINDFHGNINNYNRFPFTCNLCNKRFTNDTLLELHKYRSHNTSRNPLQCKLCDKSFSQLCNYKAHMNIHNDVRPYKCPKCMESFHQQSNLNYHIQTVHINTYRYPCKICTRIFFKMDDLIQHRRRMHFNGGPNAPIMAGRSGIGNSGMGGIRGGPQHQPHQIRIKSEFKSNNDNLITQENLISNESTTTNNTDMERKPEFKCTGCNKEYFHASSLRKHRKQYCGLVPFTCPRCLAEFQTQQEYNVHLATHKNHKPYKCTGCSKAFQFEINLTTHACPAANNNNSSSNSSSSSNTLHMSTTTTTTTTTAAAESTTTMQATTTTAAPSPSITSTSPGDRKQSHSCDICGKEVTTSSSLKKHMLIHTGIKPFACHICEKRFGRNDHLRSHLQSHERGTISAQNIRQCRSSTILEIPNVTLESKLKPTSSTYQLNSALVVSESPAEKLLVNDNLAKLEMMTATATTTATAAGNTTGNPLNIDTNEADREIDEIIKTMKKSSESEQINTTDDDIILPPAIDVEPITEITLDDISAENINESLLSSVVTTSSTPAANNSSTNSTLYPRVNNLVQITRSNYSRDKDKYGRPLRKPFKCRVCAKSFAKIYSLKYHMNTHTKQKPYECKQCYKVYFQLPSFKAHVKTHMDVKPFTCEYCDKTFTQMCTLKNHVTIHTGERPFQCNECPRAFSQIANLNSHKKTHGYKCKLCLVVVHKISHYRNHMRTHHNIDDYKLEYQQRI